SAGGRVVRARMREIDLPPKKRLNRRDSPAHLRCPGAQGGDMRLCRGRVDRRSVIAVTGEHDECVLIAGGPRPARHVHGANHYVVAVSYTVEPGAIFRHIEILDDTQAQHERTSTQRGGLGCGRAPANGPEDARLSRWYRWDEETVVGDRAARSAHESIR